MKSFRCKNLYHSFIVSLARAGFWLLFDGLLALLSCFTSSLSLTGIYTREKSGFEGCSHFKHMEYIKFSNIIHVSFLSPPCLILLFQDIIEKKKNTDSNHSVVLT